VPRLSFVTPSANRIRMFQGLLLLLLANFIGGALSPLFVKVGTSEISPIIFTFLRFFIATAIFVPFYLKHREKLSRRILFKIAVISLFFAANATFFSLGIQHTSVIVSQILYTMVPLIVGILAHFLIQEKFTRFKIFGAIISAIGVLVLISRSADNLSAGSFGTPFGNILIFIAVVSWSLYVVLSRRLSKNNNASTLTFYSFVATFILLLPIVPVEYSIVGFSFEDVSTLGYLCLLGAGTVSSALMFFLIQKGIQLTSAYIASLFSYFGPLIAAVTAIPLLNEKVTIDLVLAGVLIISGVFVATTLETLTNRGKK